MGNNQSCGFGVVNNTQHYLTIGLSMAGTHYYENMVAPGEAFYRWPGAVWYTVFVYPTKIMGEMTDAKAAKEILLTTAFGVGATVLAGGGLMLVGGLVAGAAAGTGAVAAEAGAAAGAGAVAAEAGAAAGAGAVAAEAGAAAGAGAAAAAAGGGCLAALGIGVEVAQFVAGGIGVAAGIFQMVGWQIDDKIVHLLGEFYSVLPQDQKDEVEKGYQSLKADLFESFRGRQIYTDMKGCYGGGSGTWLEVTGLPRVEISEKEPQFVGRDIKLQKRDFEYFKTRINYPSLRHGRWKFTDYSKKRYEDGLKK